MPAELCVVFGTYNRLSFLQKAVASVREHAGMPVDFIIVDGGSKDGSIEWLDEQDDVDLIRQEGPLTGAVIAFNLGFARAVEAEYPFVFHFNDDAELVTPGALVGAVEVMKAQPELGAVAFEFDLRGSWGFELVHGMTYPNFGVIRREAGMEVARAQGDPEGKKWWNPIYRTYGADTELGMWLYRLGWSVLPAVGWRVHDCGAQDELRELNLSYNPNREDSRLFWTRWRHAASIHPDKGVKKRGK